MMGMFLILGWKNGSHCDALWKGIFLYIIP